MKLIGATFSNGTFTVTLFKQDIEEIERFWQTPPAQRSKAQLVEKLALRAVFNDTGDPVIGC